MVEETSKLPPVSIRGYIEHTIWSGDNFRIVKFRPESGFEFVAKGNIYGVDSDDLIELTGEWVTDEKYGNQFRVFTNFKVVPSTLQGKQNYLAKHVEGIGPGRAGKLIKHFGSDIIKILDGPAHELTKCPGISAELSEKISKSWKKENDTFKRQVGLFLAQNGINDAVWTDKVIKTFHDKALTIIQSNPYNLTKVNGIGFRTADRIAKSLGWPSLSKERTEAAFAYALQQSTDNGHSFLFHSELIASVKKIASKDEDGKQKTLPDQDIEMALENVLGRKDLIQENIKINNKPEIVYYLRDLHQAEVDLTEKLVSIVNMPDLFDQDRVEPVISAVEGTLHYELDSDQRNAVVNAICKSVSIITGSAGTGKSTCIKTIIGVGQKLHKTVLLAAPTGRAAKRMAEITGEEATTIHRLLEYNPGEGGFVKNGLDPIEGDILIVDEFSMADLELAQSLLEAIPITMSVIFVGDPNQLPSIGPGVVLKDMIKSGKIPVTNLTKIFRQAADSLIIQNAHRIYKGEMLQFPPKGSEADSYLVEIPNENSADSVEWVKKNLPKIVDRISKKLNVSPLEDIQVLIPMRKGPAGYLEFNKVMQEHLNPLGEPFTVNGQSFRVGDRVMQVKNNYDEGIELYNGDIGFIDSYSTHNKEITIDFDGRKVNYPFASSDDLILSYCSSVHKYQGSEVPIAIIILMNQHFVMLDRNLIYTANTRAKNCAIYISSKHNIETAINKNDAHKRNSLLSFRLKSKLKDLTLPS
jgi:exodeoxyribonuclease V alpha subunit